MTHEFPPLLVRIPSARRPLPQSSVALLLMSLPTSLALFLGQNATALFRHSLPPAHHPLLELQRRGGGPRWPPGLGADALRRRERFYGVRHCHCRGNDATAPAHLGAAREGTLCAAPGGRSSGCRVQNNAAAQCWEHKMLGCEHGLMRACLILPRWQRCAAP